MQNILIESQIRKVTWRPLSSSPHLREKCILVERKVMGLKGRHAPVHCMTLGKLLWDRSLASSGLDRPLLFYFT